MVNGEVSCDRAPGEPLLGATAAESSIHLEGYVRRRSLSDTAQSEATDTHQPRGTRRQNNHRGIYPVFLSFCSIQCQVV